MRLSRVGRTAHPRDGSRDEPRTFLGAMRRATGGVQETREITQPGAELEARSAIRRLLCRLQKHGLEWRFCRAAPDTPTVQMIRAGSHQVRIVSADEAGRGALPRERRGGAVRRRSRIVRRGSWRTLHAISPSIGDVLKRGPSRSSVACPKRVFSKKKYGFDHVKVVPSPGGDISAFLRDEKFAQQCPVMSEPLQAKHARRGCESFPGGRHGLQPVHHGARHRRTRFEVIQMG